MICRQKIPPTHFEDYRELNVAEKRRDLPEEDVEVVTPKKSRVSLSQQTSSPSMLFPNTSVSPVECKFITPIKKASSSVMMDDAEQTPIPSKVVNELHRTQDEKQPETTLPKSEELDIDEVELMKLLDIDDSLPPPSHAISELNKTESKQDNEKEEVDDLFQSIIESQPCSITVHSQKEIENSLNVSNLHSSVINNSFSLETSQANTSIMNSTFQSKSVAHPSGESFLSLDDMEEFLTDDLKDLL